MGNAMNDLIVSKPSASPLPGVPGRPLPELNITIRPGVMSDVPFLDALQKLHTKQVGWMPTKQFEGKIKAGHVLVAEESRRQNTGDSRAEKPEILFSGSCILSSPGGEARRQNTEGSRAEAPNSDSSLLSPVSCILPSPLGYLIGNDQYFKRDDVGIIYQLNVLPGRQRGLIGASLLKAQFERSAWGCKLYCCWCAQDIAANHFWEAMGFVPLAFRAGSEKRSRVHIFWQKRIRAGDTNTPWWFPSQTSGGSIREDRIVLPILPGTHWSDAKPLVLPAGSSQEHSNAGWLGQRSSDAPALACDRKSSAGAAADLSPSHPTPPEGQSKAFPTARKPSVRKARPVSTPIATTAAPATITTGGLRFAPAKLPGAVEAGLPGAGAGVKEKRPREKKVKQKNDPRLVAAARELRDRWLERVNDTPLLDAAKYDVTRAIGGEARVEMEVVKRLTAA